MIRFAAAAIALTAAASAMPSDLPWVPYTCQNGKALDLKFLSDGLGVGVRLKGDDTNTLSLARAALPVIDVLQAQGFFRDPDAELSIKDGDYTGEGDALLVLKDGAIALTGSEVKDAPYENCLATPMVPPAG